MRREQKGKRYLTLQSNVSIRTEVEYHEVLLCKLRKVGIKPKENASHSI